MANTLVGQTQYTYGLGNVSVTDPQWSNQQTWTTGALGGQPYYYMYPGPTEAEKAGKAIAILKELQTDGFINIDSVEKFCEMIDKIASKI